MPSADDDSFNVAMGLATSVSDGCMNEANVGLVLMGKGNSDMFSEYFYFLS